MTQKRVRNEDVIGFFRLLTFTVSEAARAVRLEKQPMQNNDWYRQLQARQQERDGDKPNTSIRLTAQQPETIILTGKGNPPKPWWYDDRWLNVAFGCLLGIIIGVGIVLSGSTASPNYGMKVMLIAGALLAAILFGDIPIKRKLKPDFELNYYWGIPAMLLMPFFIIRLFVAHPDNCVDWSWNSVCATPKAMHHVRH